MKYLFYDSTGKVDLIYNVEPPTKLGDRYVIYNGDIPQKEGYATITKVNLETKEVYFEFKEISKTEEQIKEGRISELETALLEATALIALQEQKALENEQAILELTALIGGMM